jgi:hypothetical protein
MKDKVNPSIRIVYSLTVLCLLCSIVLALTSCNSLGSLAARARLQPSRRVLFIGNSFTSYNGGIEKQFAGLDPGSETERIDVSGYTLQNHWNDGKAVQAIRDGKWNYVVLQEQSQTPIFDQRSFRTYAAEFDQVIRNAGGRTLLLMTWERPDSVSAGITAANLANAYTSVGNAIGVNVAPAGLAFARSLRTRPDLVLYGQDGHPTQAGTFLAACVLYASIVRTSPIGNPYSGDGISAETSVYLEQVAAASSGF